MQTTTDLDAIARSLQDLTRLAAHGEQRMQRLERLNQRLALGLLGLVGLALYLGYSLATAPLATAETLLQRAEAEVAQVEQEVATAAHEAAETAVLDIAAERQAFASRMEGLRADLNQAEDMTQHAGAMVAVMLHDIKAMLEAMPGMAQNMAVMTRDVNRMTYNVEQMSNKMTVITGGINSTMGRMGSMMPWW